MATLPPVTTQRYTISVPSKVVYATLTDNASFLAQGVPITEGSIVIDNTTTPPTVLGIADGAGNFTGNVGYNPTTGAVSAGGVPFAGNFNLPYTQIATLGDSITSFNLLTVPGSPTTVAHDIRGYGSHAMAVSQGRLIIGTTYTLGSGQTIAQVLAGTPAFLSTVTERYVLVECGINDIIGYGGNSAGVPAQAASMVAQLQQIYALVRASGKIVVGVTILPSIAIAPTAAQTLLNLTVNTSLRALRDAGQLILCDWDYVYYNNDGTIPSVVSYDGTHPSLVGGERLGTQLFNTLAPFLPATTDKYWSRYGATQNISGGVLAGTGGSPIHVTSGSVPTSWTLTGPVTGSCVLSYVTPAGTDPDPTPWLQAVVTNGGAGVDSVLLQQQLTGSTAIKSRFAAEVSIDAPSDALSIIDYSIKVANFQSSPNISWYSLASVDNTKEYTAIARNRVLMTPQLSISATDMASNNCFLYLGMQLAAGKSATIRWRRVGQINY